MSRRAHSRCIRIYPFTLDFNGTLTPINTLTVVRRRSLRHSLKNDTQAPFATASSYELELEHPSSQSLLLTHPQT